MIKFNFLKNNSGQSLVELLVAVSIIAIALTAVSLLALRSLQLSEAARDREKAVILAKTKIEEVRKERDSEFWSVFRDSSLGIGTTELQIEDTFKRTTTKTRVPDDNTATRVDVTVRVEWSDFKGEHNLEQSTLLTKY